MIPRIIHYIWFGQLPKWANRHIELCRKINNNYHIMVHTQMPSELKDIADTVSSPCSWSDILRYHLINRYGGWYLDYDFYPFQNLDTINLTHDLILSYQQGHKAGDRLPFGSTPIASAPLAASPIIAAMVDKAARIKAGTVKATRTVYGPELLKGLDLDCQYLDANLFFPMACSIQEIPYVYPLLRRGWKPPGAVMAHLWASNKTCLDAIK